MPSAARTPSAEPGLQSAVGRSRQAAFWPGPQGAVAGQAVTLALSAPTLAPFAGDSLSRRVSPPTAAPSARARSMPTAATLSTCPAPPLVAMASAGTFGGFGTAGTNGRTGFPSGSPSAGPWSRFHHPLCVGALRVSDAARADATGPTASSSPRKTACGRARPDMHQ